MKVSARIDGSICGTILYLRPSQSSKYRAAFSTAEHNNDRLHIRHGIGFSRQLHPAPLLPFNRSQKAVQSISFDPSYCTATCYSRQQPLTSNPFTPYPFQSHSPNYTSSNNGVLGSAVARQNSVWSKEKLLAFVDGYDGSTVEEHLEYLRDPYMRHYAPPARPELTVSDELRHVAAPSPEYVQEADEEVQQVITQLRAAVFERFLRPHSVDLDTIYNLYRSLPDQRVPYLTARLRHALLAALAMVERKNARSMLRYFAIVADVKNSGFALTQTEWNTAMSFAARYVGLSSETEVEAALHLWRDMERKAGIPASDVTFNILFDVASKAGKFALAEMIYQEMNSRGYEFNRYHHVSLIHYFGLKMDASGVRAAYKGMVEAGEIIDSTVLNCVIAGMLRSGEDDSAERVYEKMKASTERSKIIPQRDYTMQKRMTQVLLMFARLGRKHPHMHDQFQSTGVLSPDLHTYRILVKHYGVKMGNLSKVAKFLDEMKWFRIPLQGTIFLALFKSFALHGGVPGGDWSLQRLEAVWGAFLDAYDSGVHGIYISTWMAMWALRAFAKCSQSKVRIVDVYEDLSSRWVLDSQNSSFMIDFLDKLLPRGGSPVPKRLKRATESGTRNQEHG